MNGQMTFTKIVKLIHPDSNPDIENAGEKMREAIKNRSDNNKLYRLAVRWGLVEDEIRQEATWVDEPRDSNGIVCVDDVVEFDHPQYGTCSGVVVEIKPNGTASYEIFIVTMHGVLAAKRSSLRAVGDFRRKYRANENMVRRAKQAYRRATGSRTSRPVNRQDGERFVLQRNTDYRGQNSYIFVNGFKELIRTTEKFAFYYDPLQNKERRKSIDKVYFAIKR